LGAGADFQTVDPDQWNNDNDIATSNQEPWATVSGSTFRLAGVMLSTDGSTKFTSGSAAEELAKCQRYYEKSYDIAVAPATVTNVGIEYYQAQGTTTYRNVPWKVTKRLTSGMTFTAYNSATGATGTWRDFSNTTDKTVTTQIKSERSCGISHPSVDNAIMYGHWTVDAEL